MKKVVLAFLLGIVTVFAAACGAQEETEAKKDSITIKHELGETLVPKNPEKVVVFDFAALDTLTTLGVEVTGLPKDAIPSYLSQYKDDKYENVGALKEPDFEKISILKPDVIIISGRQMELYEEFSKIAPTIYLGLDYENYMESFKYNTEILGQVFDKEQEVKDALAKIDEEVAALHKETSALNTNALVILANEGKISAYGANSRFGVIHEEFGITPVDNTIEASTHGQSISYEYILEKNPDYIYVVDRGAVVAGGASSAQQVMENAVVKQTNAFKNNHIVYLNAEYWYSASGGLTAVQEMIQEVAKSIQ